MAPLELRVAYVARREGLAMDTARKRVQTKDRARERYMQTQYHCQHEDPHIYDLVIDTAVLDYSEQEAMLTFPIIDAHVHLWNPARFRNGNS